MKTLLKGTAAALFLVSGLAVTASAQTAGPTVAVMPAPSPADLGPRTNSRTSIPGYQQPVAAPAPVFGPAPGASDAKAYPHYDAPATYTSDPSMRPYNTGTVRPN